MRRPTLTSSTLTSSRPSASLAEIQELADKILERLGVRIRAGQVIIPYDDGRVQRVETRTIHQPRRPSGLGLHPRAPAVAQD